MRALPARALIVTAFLLVAAPARATLGEPESSVDAVQAGIFSIHRKATVKASYTVHELTTNTGVVREFISQSGVVFAITWQGVAQPDLTLLLGTYYKEYRDETLRMRTMHGHSPHSISTSNLVLERSGHMRAEGGRVFMPNLIPSGVSKDEIR